MQDKIEKTIDLKAPVSRVWQALTDHQQFGEWFRVKLDAPFVLNELVTGQVTYPGYEHMKWEATIKAIEPQSRFAFAWCPLNDADGAEKSRETLVEFKLKATDTGTQLSISESGFAAWPGDPKIEEAYQRNSEGWAIQSDHIRNYVEA